jgi:hypothetical protein
MTYFKTPLTKNSLKYLAIFIIVLTITHCTYDKSLIYKKNYEVNSNSSLRLDGYYNAGYRKIFTNTGYVDFMYPIFFYKDGSVIIMGAIKDTSLLRKNITENPKAIWGYWGNYQISNDTINIETIASYGGSFHHERHFKLGLIKKDSICFFQELDRNGSIKEMNETVQFSGFSIKPDSTENWIRYKRKYNK